MRIESISLFSMFIGLQGSKCDERTNIKNSLNFNWFLLTSFSNIWVTALRVWLICKCDLSLVSIVSHLRSFFFQNRCEIISDKPDTWKGLSLHWKNSWPYWVLHLLGFNNCAITSLSGKHLPLLLDWCTLHNFQMYYKWIKAWTWCWHSKWNWMTNLRSVLKIRDTGRNVSQKVDRSWILRLLFPYSYTI